MKELTISEVKELEFELLVKFDDICRTHQWRYSLGGGSLLGAVRHHGFIPWDDDIDIIMPRPDYDKFVESSKNSNWKFVVRTHETTQGYNMLHGKIMNPNTVLIDSSINNSTYTIGIHIDIFPVDGLGQTYKEALRTFNRTALSRELLNAKTWKRYFKSKTHPFYYEPFRFLLFLISRFVDTESLINAIDKENRRFSFDTEQFAGCVSGCYRDKEILPQKVFSEYCEIPFEGRLFKCLMRYDDYLKSLYGDYMKLPPKEKQKSHHTFKAFLVES